MATLHPISQSPLDSREVDVVFVHGLGGDAFETWRHGQDENTSWPHWLAERFGSRVGIWSLGYAASASGWGRWKEKLKRRLGMEYDRDKGYTMPLADRASHCLDLLQQNGIGQLPTIYIVHSLGGLLVKYMLRFSHDARPGTRERDVIKNCRAVLFLATPHQGSRLADLSSKLSINFPTVSVQELKDNSSHLRELYRWYRNQSPQYGIETRSYYEIRATEGIVLVVEADSADPGVPPPLGKDPVPLDKDHIEISKPLDRMDSTYRESEELILKQLKVNPDPLAPVLDNQPGEITDPFAHDDFHFKMMITEQSFEKLQRSQDKLGTNGYNLSHSIIRCCLFQGRDPKDLWEREPPQQHAHSSSAEEFAEPDKTGMDRLWVLWFHADKLCKNLRKDRNINPRIFIHIYLPIEWLSTDLPSNIRRTMKDQPVFFGCSNRSSLREASAINQLREHSIQLNGKLSTNRKLSNLSWASAHDPHDPDLTHYHELIKCVSTTCADSICLSASDLDPVSGAEGDLLVDRDALLALQPVVLFGSQPDSRKAAWNRWHRILRVGLPLVFWLDNETPVNGIDFHGQIKAILRESWTDLCKGMQLLQAQLHPRQSEQLQRKGFLQFLGCFYEDPLRAPPGEDPGATRSPYPSQLFS